jgi:hypothetical protein
MSAAMAMGEGIVYTLFPAAGRNATPDADRHTSASAHEILRRYSRHQ